MVLGILDVKTPAFFHKKKGESNFSKLFSILLYISLEGIITEKNMNNSL
jgi:hypothetical protein